MAGERRLFGQPRFAETDLRLQEFKGPAYKFEIFLLISGRARKRLFNEKDIKKLRTLLNADFGGCSYRRGLTHPLLEGEWINEQGQVEHNVHVVFEVFGKQDERCLEYFKQLKKRLEKVSREEIILIQMTPILIVS